MTALRPRFLRVSAPGCRVAAEVGSWPGERGAQQDVRVAFFFLKKISFLFCHVNDKLKRVSTLYYVLKLKLR